MKLKPILTLLALLTISCQNDKSVTSDVSDFSRRVETLLEDMQLDSLNDIINYDELVRRVIKNKRLSNPEKSGVRNQFYYQKAIATKIINNRSEYESVKLIKTYVENNRFHSLYEFKKDNLLNYLIIELSTFDEGVRIVDGVVFSDGIWFADEMRSIGVVKDYNTETTFDKGYAIQSVKNSLTEKKYDLARKQLDNIPSKYKGIKAFRNLELLLEMKTSEKDFLIKRQKFDREFPGSKFYSLYLSLVLYKQSEDCNKYFEIISQFESIVGKNNSLKFMNKKCLEKT